MLRLAKASTEECIAMRIAVERKLRRVRLNFMMCELELERAKMCERESKSEEIEIRNILDIESRSSRTAVCS